MQILYCIKCMNKAEVIFNGVSYCLNCAKDRQTQLNKLFEEADKRSKEFDKKLK